MNKICSACGSEIDYELASYDEFDNLCLDCKFYKIAARGNSYV